MAGAGDVERRSESVCDARGDEARSANIHTGAGFAQTMRNRYGRGCGSAMGEGAGYPYSPEITVRP